MPHQLFNSIQPGSTLEVLIVEESSVFAKLLKFYIHEIKDYTIKVHWVDTYEHAKKFLIQQQYDAVLLNLYLPDYPHEEIYHSIKEIIPDTAIIITTSSNDPTEAILAVKEGAQDFLLKKEINEVLLRKTILFAIDRQHAQQMAEEREKLLLTRLIGRNRQTAPINMKLLAEKTTRSLKKINIGFPEKRKAENLWDDFLFELNKSFKKHGLETGNVEFDEDNDGSQEIVNTKRDSIPKEALVAEDSPINRKICRIVGEKIGIQMTFVNNGLKAVDAFRKKAYPLIFMDIQMPVMDGLEATQIIRSEFPINIQPKIIALTASNLNQYEEIFNESGIDASINKPIKKDNVEVVLKELFNPKENLI